MLLQIQGDLLSFGKNSGRRFSRKNIIRVAYSSSMSQFVLRLFHLRFVLSLMGE